MRKFTALKSTVIPLKEEDVDTDQILPAAFLKTVEKTGLGDKLFYSWRYGENGQETPSIFNDVSSKKAKILLVERDFGVGSSREHAVWALEDYGIRCIIGISFGDIFYMNCLKNGILAIRVARKELTALFDLVEKDLNADLTIDLEKQWIELPDKTVFPFSIDPFRKTCLLSGLDEIKYVLSKEKYIEEFERREK